VISPLSHPVLAQGEGVSDTSGLSPYWQPVVSRWERIVVRYAEERHFDPDFVASVIWKESRGISTVQGPTGAVGLMCIKPFPWRPSAEALENPWTNVAAGTKTLAQVIRDGNGDVYYALAAYNGGWDQIHLRVTRSYATDVLDNYARAVAVEHGLPADGDWIAIISVEGLPDHKTVTVLGPDRPLARYTERPCPQADVPSAPEGSPPHATLIAFTDERGQEVRVSLWLVARDHSSLGTLAVLPASAQSSRGGESADDVLRQTLEHLPD
jgi:hypothetical protein